MWNKRKGVRLRKTLRGNEISLDTIQINTKVVKEGVKKFNEIFKKEEAKVEGKEEVKEETKSDEENKVKIDEEKAGEDKGSE